MLFEIVSPDEGSNAHLLMLTTFLTSSTKLSCNFQNTLKTKFVVLLQSLHQKLWKLIYFTEHGGESVLSLKVNCGGTTVF